MQKTALTEDVDNTTKPWHEVYCIDGYELTQEQKQAMFEEVYQPEIDWEIEVKRRNERLLKVIKSSIGEVFCNNLINYLEYFKSECYYAESMQYELVRETTGKFQEEEYLNEPYGIWCDQWSVGMEGDSWSGYVYIKIDDRRYLKVGYSM